MKNTKYEITSETHPTRSTLKRIRALRDFSDIKKGELGGFIESEDNLSHEGDCWVSGNAHVFGNASVYGDAMVYENAQVSEDASVYGKAWVSGNAVVSGNAMVAGTTGVFKNAWISGGARVTGDDLINETRTSTHGLSEITIDGIVYSLIKKQ